MQDESEPARIVGDAVIAAFFSADKPRAREAERQKVESWITLGLIPDWDRLRSKGAAFRTDVGWRPFHWEIEFPEVFDKENPGFDAIVGNPPFAGKNTVIASNPDRPYLPWLQTLHTGAHGNADLVAHFFRRAFDLLNDSGAFGLIASKTIGQGDSRSAGLATILGRGGRIFRATKRFEWPNQGAAVVVSIVHVAKNVATKQPVLDGHEVQRISAYLVTGGNDEAPARLAENLGKAFQGSILLGIGFTFDDKAALAGESESIARMHELIASNDRNSSRIKPFIGGAELSTSPTHAHHRYAIDFEDFPLRRDLSLIHPWHKLTEKTRSDQLRSGIVSADFPGPVAEDWPDLLEVVEQRVKPQRLKQADEGGKHFWWRFLRPRGELYSVIKIPNWYARQVQQQSWSI